MSIDGLPWRWADAGGTDAILVVGLEPGPHSLLIELETRVHGSSDRRPESRNAQLLLDVLGKPLGRTWVIFEEVQVDDWSQGGLPLTKYRKRGTAKV